MITSNSERRALAYSNQSKPKKVIAMKTKTGQSKLRKRQTKCAQDCEGSEDIEMTKELITLKKKDTSVPLHLNLRKIQTKNVKTVKKRPLLPKIRKRKAYRNVQKKTRSLLRRSNSKFFEDSDSSSNPESTVTHNHPMDQYLSALLALSIVLVLASLALISYLAVRLYKLYKDPSDSLE
jgi:hypothetical protein